MLSCLRVSVDSRIVELAPGDEFPFGRAPGPGQITESRKVSSVHGVLRVSAGSWSVTSTGTYHGFTVLDVETPSRLTIPRGAGPVVVPFARAVIAVEVEHRRYVIEVDARSMAAPNWAEAWDSYVNRGSDPEHEPASNTVMAWSRARFLGRSGKPLQWYRVLVAMCEPRLRLPASSRADRIPSNRELADRLGITVKVIEKYLEQLRDELGFSRYGEQMRSAAVLVAISQGLVTTADLAVLDGEGDP